MTDALTRRALEWAEHDPDPQTAAEVRALVQANDSQLADRFSGHLAFGTAGLRGVLGGGTNRMNRAVVRRTTAGLAKYLLQHQPEVQQRGVVLGRDGRRQSDVFTRDAAGVFAAAGIPVYVFAEVVPTPVTAFALTELGAVAAVMVTASHNPPEYNGYKVYWSNGAQIVPPHDHGIAAAIDAIGPANQVALLSEGEARAAGLWRDVAPSVEKAYFSAIAALVPVPMSAPSLPIVYTAMHGVGGRFVMQALGGMGFRAVTSVPEQHAPDGEFPTVRFPNPEEKGAMDLSLALAERVGAELVLANDPDADRLAVMARRDGSLQMLSGNEVGVLLGHFMLTQRPSSKPLVITTIVSSAQLSAIAQALRAGYAETLTGFKWVANEAIRLEKAEGYTFVMGYEEALGYTVGTVARDKDGVGAALVVAAMAAWCHSRGVTLWGYLEEVQRAHGLFVATQYNATLPGADGASVIKGIMSAFRQSPASVIGAYRVVAVSDYGQGIRTAGQVVTRLTLPPADVIAYELEGGGRVTLRPSGTEPKMKFYFELKEELAPGESLPTARARAQAKLVGLEAAFIAEAKKVGLP
jgi:phosphomannomutase